MTALTTDRVTPRRDGVDYNDPVGANAKFFAGALVCLNATGYAVPGSVSATLKARGVAQANVDNTGGADGAVSVDVKAGVFRFTNDGTISRADIGATAYIVDDQTVADNNGTNTRSAAGTIVDVDSVGVWVKVG